LGTTIISVSDALDGFHMEDVPFSVDDGEEYSMTLSARIVHFPL
jgi:hypothetical protein